MFYPCFEFIFLLIVVHHILCYMTYHLSFAADRICALELRVVACCCSSLFIARRISLFLLLFAVSRQQFSALHLWRLRNGERKEFTCMEEPGMPILFGYRCALYKYGFLFISFQNIFRIKWVADRTLFQKPEV